MLRVGFIGSGNGHVFDYVKKNIDQGLIDAKIELVLTDRTCGLSERAQSWAGCKVINLNCPLDTSSQDVSEQINNAIDDELDLICLAYNRLIHGDLLKRYAGRIVNIHLSLLPAFPGFKAIENTLTTGGTTGGVTIHCIDKGVDTGPIIVQSVIPLAPDLSQENYMQKQYEFLCKGLAQTVQWYAEKRVEVQDGRAFVSRGHYQSLPTNPAIEKDFLDV